MNIVNGVLFVNYCKHYHFLTVHWRNKLIWEFNLILVVKLLHNVVYFFLREFFKSFVFSVVSVDYVEKFCFLSLCKFDNFVSRSSSALHVVGLLFWLVFRLIFVVISHRNFGIFFVHKFNDVFNFIYFRFETEWKTNPILNSDVVFKKAAALNSVSAHNCCNLLMNFLDVISVKVHYRHANGIHADLICLHWLDIYPFKIFDSFSNKIDESFNFFGNLLLIVNNNAHAETKLNKSSTVWRPAKLENSVVCYHTIVNDFWIFF